MSKTFKHSKTTALTVAQQAALTKLRRKAVKADRRRQSRIQGLVGRTVEEALSLSETQ